ncbi:hypothetical protein QP166_02515 [Sphingomonas sp. LR60]|uniref:hypothetical protein n=1 Tax=Sphingomonas sp. LR60 TaxID=3050233 RepID=UPI002FE024F1
MIFSVSLALSVMLLGTPSTTPAPGREAPLKATMDKMERRIATAPCVGSPDKWERRYFYKTWVTGTVFHLDEAVIKFEYYEAGKFEFKEGRKFYIDPPLPMMDDRRFRIAYGYYDWTKDRVTLLACGKNA